MLKTVKVTNDNWALCPLMTGPNSESHVCICVDGIPQWHELANPEPNKEIDGDECRWWVRWRDNYNEITLGECAVVRLALGVTNENGFRDLLRGTGWYSSMNPDRPSSSTNGEREGFSPSQAPQGKK